MRLLSLLWRRIRGKQPILGAAKEEPDDGKN